MVTVIATSHWHGEGRSLDNHTDFVPHSTARLYVENALFLEQGCLLLQPGSTIDILLFSLPTVNLLEGLQFISNSYSIVNSRRGLGLYLIFIPLSILT